MPFILLENLDMLGLV